MVQADYAYIPLSDLVGKGTKSSKTFLQTCVTGVISNPNDCHLNDANVTNCVAHLAFDCLFNVPTVTINDVALPTGHFLTCLSYIGKRIRIDSVLDLLKL